MALTSPVLALLNEPEYSLKEYALQSLNENVNEIWPEIADHISQIEELHEDTAFPAQALAALVVAKVYYNLGDFEASVRYALAAGSQLDLSRSSEFVDTIISKATQMYVQLRQRDNDAGGESLSGVDPKLVEVVERMLDRCVARGEVTLALGIALESRRLDVIETIITAQPRNEYIQFVLDSSIKILANREFRNKVLRSLEQHILGKSAQPDYLLLIKIIIQLEDHTMAVRLFRGLLSEGKPGRSTALGYQLAFDLVSTASQELLEKISAEFVGSPQPSHSRLVKILSGEPTCDFEVTFLQKNNHTDTSVLTRTKTAFDSRNSMFHSAISFQNAFLHAGTTADNFFRSNIDWLGRAQNWTKFTATAALGVIHRGNLTQGRRILQPYLPGGQGSAHSRGGALYGLGLIFAGFGKEVLEYLQEVITDLDGADQSSEEQNVVLHGACLGVALAAMRTGNIEVYETLRNVLYHDSAVAGEAAGLAMGLVMLGSKSAVAEEEMLQYAHDTQHEKIIRSLAIGLALLNYGKEEGSNKIIETLMGEQDPILRYGGCFTIALAYAGTGNNKAIKMLLHTAVSDASDDVRRAAVMALGFILLRNPTALPRMVELLSESHNPHVRYGTTMALGVACAGTGLHAAVDVLEPMTKDPVDFVRQGAMIALAMILIQQTEQTNPRAKQAREQFAAVVGAKHEDAMAKFGAALAQGIIDAGGCNATITLEHQNTGNLNMKAVTGLAVFLQYWYWFPLAHFAGLAFSATTIVGVREVDLKIPDFSMPCDAPRMWFDYPPRVGEENTKTPEKLVTAILSTTHKGKWKGKKSKRSKAVGNANEMDVDTPPKGRKDTRDATGKDGAKDGSKDLKDSSDKKAAVAGAPNSAVEDEEASFEVKNVSRVVPWQREFIRYDPAGRFQPLLDRAYPSGVIIVTDKRPEEDYTLIKTLRQNHSEEDEDNEAPLPAPFQLAPELDEE